MNIRFLLVILVGGGLLSDFCPRSKGAVTTVSTNMKAASHNNNLPIPYVVSNNTNAHNSTKSDAFGREHATGSKNYLQQKFNLTVFERFMPKDLNVIKTHKPRHRRMKCKRKKSKEVTKPTPKPSTLSLIKSHIRIFNEYDDVSKTELPMPSQSTAAGNNNQDDDYVEDDDSKRKDDKVEDTSPKMQGRTPVIEEDFEDMDQASKSFFDKLWNRHKKNRGQEVLQYFMQVLVVADRSFVDFHSEIDHETYLLTAMNMVADLFIDMTLGLEVIVSVVKVVYVDKEAEAFNSSRANIALQEFCHWANRLRPADMKSPYHHDVAVLVTRRELMGKLRKPIIAATYIASACLPCKSCMIVQDTGLMLGVNIAHQIGHLLGAPDDDGSDSKCPAEAYDRPSFDVIYHHIMSPHLEHERLLWSYCSRLSITKFFRDGLGSCLEDIPPRSVYMLPRMLPGTVFDADMQCDLILNGSKACFLNDEEICLRLFCDFGNGTCVSNDMQPAQGTSCGINKWCFNMRCVHVGYRPAAISGRWSDWDEWGPCSRTCGGGVQTSRRYCNNPPPSFSGHRCMGSHKRDRICNTNLCDPRQLSFRNVQCANFNRVPISGMFHKWRAMPTDHPEDACALFCVNQRNMTSKLSARVADGTPCRKGTNDLCISGICKHVGCDWLLGSKTIDDRCGVCGGLGTACHQVDVWYNYTHSTVDEPYILVASIPKWSTYIRISEEKETGNRLAIALRPKNSTNVFLIGGPDGTDHGEFFLGQKLGYYTHLQQCRAYILINGPIPFDIDVYIAREGRCPIVPIHYTYMLLRKEPITVPHIPKVLEDDPNFGWEFTTWEPCTARCEGGVRQSVASCVSVYTGVVDDFYCRNTEKPTDMLLACNTQPCHYRWKVGPWCCSCPCNAETRSVLCMRQSRLWYETDVLVESSHCTDLKPPSSRKCTPDICNNDNQILDLFKMEHALNYGFSPGEMIGFQNTSEGMLQNLNLLGEKSFTRDSNPYLRIDSDPRKYSTDKTNTLSLQCSHPILINEIHTSTEYDMKVKPMYQYQDATKTTTYKTPSMSNSMKVDDSNLPRHFENLLKVTNLVDQITSVTSSLSCKCKNVTNADHNTRIEIDSSSSKPCNCLKLCQCGNTESVVKSTERMTTAYTNKTLTDRTLQFKNRSNLVGDSDSSTRSSMQKLCNCTSPCECKDRMTNSPSKVNSKPFGFFRPKMHKKHKMRYKGKMNKSFSSTSTTNSAASTSFLPTIDHDCKCKLLCPCKSTLKRYYVNSNKFPIMRQNINKFDSHENNVKDEDDIENNVKDKDNIENNVTATDINIDTGDRYTDDLKNSNTIEYNNENTDLTNFAKSKTNTFKIHKSFTMVPHNDKTQKAQVSSICRFPYCMLHNHSISKENNLYKKIVDGTLGQSNDLSLDMNDAYTKSFDVATTNPFYNIHHIYGSSSTPKNNLQNNGVICKTQNCSKIAEDNIFADPLYEIKSTTRFNYPYFPYPIHLKPQNRKLFSNTTNSINPKAQLLMKKIEDLKSLIHKEKNKVHNLKHLSLENIKRYVKRPKRNPKEANRKSVTKLLFKFRTKTNYQIYELNVKKKKIYIALKSSGIHNNDAYIIIETVLSSDDIATLATIPNFKIKFGHKTYNIIRNTNSTVNVGTILKGVMKNISNRKYNDIYSNNLKVNNLKNTINNKTANIAVTNSKCPDHFSQNKWEKTLRSPNKSKYPIIVHHSEKEILRSTLKSYPNWSTANKYLLITPTTVPKASKIIRAVEILNNPGELMKIKRSTPKSKKYYNKFNKKEVTSPRFLVTKVSDVFNIFKNKTLNSVMRNINKIKGNESKCVDKTHIHFKRYYFFDFYDVENLDDVFYMKEKVKKTKCNAYIILNIDNDNTIISLLHSRLTFLFGNIVFKVINNSEKTNIDKTLENLLQLLKYNTKTVNNVTNKEKRKSYKSNVPSNKNCRNQFNLERYLNSKKHFTGLRNPNMMGTIAGKRYDKNENSGFKNNDHPVLPRPIKKRHIHRTKSYRRYPGKHIKKRLRFDTSHNNCHISSNKSSCYNDCRFCYTEDYLIIQGRPIAAKVCCPPCLENCISEQLYRELGAELPYIYKTVRPA